MNWAGRLKILESIGTKWINYLILCKHDALPIHPRCCSKFC